MGLMRKWLSAFGARQESTSHDTPSPNGAAVAVLDAAALRESKPFTHHKAGESSFDPPKTSGGIRNGEEDDDDPLPPAPQNRRELMEELQKNYREVVSLVRKVNTHLDRVETRSTRLMDIADRLEPALDRIADEFRTHGEDALAAHREMSAEIVQTIQRHLDAGRQGHHQLIQAVENIGEQMSVTANAQGQLVTTMAHFRQSMNEIAASNQHAGHVLESLRDASRDRDEALASVIRSSFRWNLLIFITSTTLGLGALGTALYLLLSQG